MYLFPNSVLWQKDSSFLGYAHLYPGVILQYKKQQEQELAQEEARELTGFHVCPSHFIFVYSGFEIQFLKIEHFSLHFSSKMLLSVEGMSICVKVAVALQRWTYNCMHILEGSCLPANFFCSLV
jgi:hypothetical protein